MLGTTVSHYEIREKLGAGGMGVVYKAWDTQLDRWVALKFLPQHLEADPMAGERFIREARAASALEHPHICTVHEIGRTDEGQQFICMAYYAGPNLSQVIRSGDLPLNRVLEVSRQLCSALGSAHNEGIIHRDLKPSNIMTTAQGDVAIVDFGLAKLAGEVPITRSGAVMGTTAYMSPEQLRGKKLDHRTDLWALGVILYELLTGSHPFAGDYEQAFKRSILEDAPNPPSTIREGISSNLDEVTARLLSKDPSDRYSSAGEVRQLLHSTSGGSFDSQMQTERVTPESAPGSTFRPRSRWWSFLLASVALVVTLTVWSTRNVPTTGPTPDLATTPVTETEAYDSFVRAQNRLDQLQDPTRIESALALLRESLRLNPDFAPAHAALGQVLVQAAGSTGNITLLEEAEGAVRRALELEPRLPAAQIALAQVNRETNRNAEAIATLQRLVSAEPDLDLAYMELAICYERAGELSKAETNYRQAVKRRPNHWMHWNNLGAHLMMLGEMDQARDALQKAIDYSPVEINWARENLGSLEITVGNFAQALEVYDQFPRPIGDAWTASNIGTAHYGLNQLEEAEIYFRMSVRLLPKDPGLRGNLADLLLRLGRREDAQSEYLLARDLVLERLVLDPQNENLRIDSALYLAKSGDCPRALIQGQELEKSVGSTPASAHNIAKVYAFCGDEVSALRVIQLAIELGRPIESIAVDEEFESLTNDPEFRLLVEADGPDRTQMF
jgi:serine/threonine protein kinase/Tfp pilus assembly protein PilF